MSSITHPTLAEVITAIRELILDVNPVSCFSLQKQGLSFNSSNTQVDLTGSTTATALYSTYVKQYQLLNWLRDKGITIKLSVDYNAVELSNIITPVVTPTSLDTELLLQRPYYFSDQFIYSQMLKFFQRYYDYRFSPYMDVMVYYKSSMELSEMVYNLDLFEIQKVIFWTAYWLIEEKRKNAASIDYLKSKNGESVVCSESFKNYNTQTTVMIGSTYREVESPEGDGKGTEDFTSLWGDKYGYLTKLQLFIRNQFEKIFNDYSLRDGAMVSTTVPFERQYLSSMYADTHSLSRLSREVLLPSLLLP
jgi:hypothetical protein